MDNRPIKTSVILEEYFSLQVLIDRGDEPGDYLSYFKETTSLLEISVGMTTRLIKKITLLLTKEYDITYRKLDIDNYEIGDLKIEDNPRNSCSYFKTHVYRNGIRIVLSEEKTLKYIKMDRLYVGLSCSGRIVEICLCQLSPKEVKHIKRELKYESKERRTGLKSVPGGFWAKKR